ncbi:MAG: PilC/PilY family type IV pilus protein [Pseudomonadota bacterium]
MKNLPIRTPRKTHRPNALALGIKLGIKLALALASAPLLLSLQAQAALPIPNSPLQSGSGVAANLMYILDDSGSMHWEIMPDSITYREYNFPPPTHVYGGQNYSDGSETIVSFADTSNVNTMVRSWHNNKVHYNPTINYTPWAKYDGTSFGDSDPTRARYNPYDVVSMPGSTCNGTWDRNNRCVDLTAQQSYNRWSNPSSTSAQNYWPITFYQYKGTGDIWSTASYIKYQIRGNQGYKQDLNGGAETQVTSFTWPGGITRSVAEEKQNFANWFSYYRSRILSVRGGTGLAFLNLDAKSFRVGFTTINNGGINYQIPITSSPTDGNFEGTYKQNFYERLYQWPMPQSGTPLRRALKVVGDNYKNATSGGPWAPDIGGGGLQVSCRQSFAILTTDGYWNGPNQGVGNEDGTNGLVITGPSGSFQYIAANPYKDTRSDTLADIAMKYWKEDLRTESFMTNDVPTSSADPAFWQHMSTFGVSLGANGTLDPANDLAALTAGTLSWPDPFSSTPAKIDDLWHATLNGRGAFVAAQDPNQFAAALKGTLGQISDRVASASNISGNSTSISTDSMVFQAKYTGGKWHGEVVATRVTDTGFAATPSWLATNGIPAAASRNIWAWKDATAKGVRFEYANLGAAQQAVLGSASVVDYLRGDQSQEQSNGGAFRNRVELLGDIVNSSPIYVKDSNSLFVGANDGMLHAFNATTGAETLAYIPGALINTDLKSLSDPAYTHRYFMDGAIAVSSQAQTSSHNYLTAAFGRGGKGLIGLDVTTPSAFASANALWEYDASRSDNDMGYILGKPFIAKTNGGDWVVVTGNGYNSANERAVLYIINLTTGALIKKIDTGAGSSSQSNGLTTPKGWDVEGDGDVDYIYAGDLLGNMWKFDVNHPNSAQWQVANSGAPMFVAMDSSGLRQPITGGVSIATNPISTDPNFGKRYVFFGTGQYLTQTDSANTNTQSWYGLIDEGATIARSDLKQRSIIAKQGNARAFSKASSGDMTGKKGWYVDLLTPGGSNGGREGERIVSDNQVIGTVLIASSIIPGSSSICSAGGEGYVNVIDPFSGGSLSQVFFDYNNNKQKDDGDKLTVGTEKYAIGSINYGVNMPGEGLLMTSQDGTGWFSVGGSNGNNGGGGAFPPYPTGRISWREIIGN